MGETRVCVLALAILDDQVKNQRFRRSDELKRELKEVVSEAELLEVSSPKKQARKASDYVQTDEILCSGNSDPIVIQNDDNAPMLETCSSNNNNNYHNGLCVSGNDEVNNGEITSESSSPSCTESGFCTSYPTEDSVQHVTTTESSSPSCTESGFCTSYPTQDSVQHVTNIENSSPSCTESGFCTSYPTQDSVKHVASNPAVRKIRFKIIHKPSEEFSSIFSNSSAQKLSNELNDGTDDADKRSTLCSWSVGKTLNQRPDMFVAGTKKIRSEGGKKRNDELHKALFLPYGLADGTYLSYNVKGQKILEGYKQDNGIFCNHCSSVVSPSQFEAHAGMSTRKKPYQHIYVADGCTTLHNIALFLAEEGKQFQTAAHMNGDTEGFSSRSRPKKMIMRRHSRPAAKKSGTDHGGNCVLCTDHDFSVNRFDDRTVIICDQCEKEYHVGCLRDGGLCNLKELPQDKWFCCQDCDRIFTSLRNFVARGSELIPFSQTSNINKKLLGEGLCEVDAHDVQWRLLNGKCCHPEDQPLLAKVVYLFRKGFNPITTVNGRDLIPMMVHGKNVAEQEFGGMYCVVLTVKSVVVSAGLLRICGRELAELPLVATKTKYQGKGYFLALFSCIEELLISLKVEKLVLPAAEDAKAMWVNRFGFTEMSQEKLCTYIRMFQLTGFHETVMLEKQLAKQQLD